MSTSSANTKSITGDRIGGMLLGVFTGDALGAAYEFKKDMEKLKTYNGTIKDKVTSFNRFTKTSKTFPLGTVTDDSEMTIALIRALCAKGIYNRDSVISEYLKWANSSGTHMMGKNTRELLKGVTTINGYQNRMNKMIKEAEDKKQEITQSNGSLMRACPLAVLNDFNNIYTDCDITNPNTVNRDCSSVYVVMLWLLLRGYQLDEIYPMIKSAAKTQEIKDLLVFVEAHPPIKGSNGSLIIKDKQEFLYLTEGSKKSWVVNALYCALVALKWSFIPDVENAFGALLDWVIQHPGSDTDTNAAIAGAVIGAKYGYQAIIKHPKNKDNVSLVLNPHMSQGDVCNIPEYRLSVQYFTELCTGLYTVAKGKPYVINQSVRINILSDPKRSLIKLNIDTKDVKTITLVDPNVKSLTGTEMVLLKRVGGQIVNQYDVYIGRAINRGGWDLPASKWGNPFTVSKYGTADAAVAEYEKYIRNNPGLIKALPELAGKKLGCWCKKPDKEGKYLMCHGYVLIKLLREYNM